MSEKDIAICHLADLDKMRSAPKLDKEQSKMLFNELSYIIHKSDWLTIGVMSPSLKQGINAVRKIEEKFKLRKGPIIKIVREMKRLRNNGINIKPKGMRNLKLSSKVSE